MRRFITAASFILAAQVYAAPAFLTPTESRTLVQAIDDICADSWCSGDLNYLFHALECGPDSCTFDVSAQILNRDENGIVTSQDERPYRCELKGFHSRADLVNPDSSRLTYSQELYDAMSGCLTDQLALAHPVVYLPEVKKCRASIEQKPYFRSAAHSIYADVFHEKDAVQASEQVLNDMVVAYSQTDSSCQHVYYMAFRDRVQCSTINNHAVCSLPASEGQFLVVKDYVDSAAVLYFKGEATQPAVLGKSGKAPVKTQLADVSACYMDLLNLNNTQPAAQPFAAMDHRSYFVSTKNLKASKDARVNASQLVNSVVRDLSRSAAKTCSYEERTVTLDSSACQQIQGRDVCLIQGGNNGGYFIVSKDDATGAFVTFIRFD